VTPFVLQFNGNMILCDNRNVIFKKMMKYQKQWQDDLKLLLDTAYQKEQINLAEEHYGQAPIKGAVNKKIGKFRYPSKLYKIMQKIETL
jgi:hypothetical protein